MTHRRIDKQAELPPGSTSKYIRTRHALLNGVAEAILKREVAGMEATFAPRSDAELLDGLVALLDRTTEARRTLTSARLVHGGQPRSRPARDPPARSDHLGGSSAAGAP